MIPDVNLKSYYLQFISNANTDIVTYNENLSQTKKIKEELYIYLESNANALSHAYNINLNTYDKEWLKKEYNPIESLYTKTIKLVNNVKEDENRIILLQLVKYCGALRSENKYNRLIVLAGTRKTIKFGQYRTYVANYYNKVHKTVLEGMGYKFSYGIGTYVINHWKLDKDRKKVIKRLDYNATNINKRKLIAAGVKIYNDYEAAWHLARKIPYDGVEYRIYKEESAFFEFTFIKSDIFTNNSLEYKRTEYVYAKYRGMSYTEMADKLCKTIEDIYNLQVDIKYKLNMILHKDPTKYLNFIRNAEQHKYKHGAHNS